MALLSDLSVELLCLIFEYAYYSSSRNKPGYHDLDTISDIASVRNFLGLGEQLRSMRDDTSSRTSSVVTVWPWMDDNVRSLALFPYNIRAVCPLWHNIVVCSPEYWTRIIFDVANDPTTLLDAFSWSTYFPIDVFVFSSASDAIDDQAAKARESGRVESIVARLQPHIERCIKIVFDIQFSSSLPSPLVVFTRNAALLTDLRLDCRIDDLGCDVADASNIDIVTPAPQFVFRDIKLISLTGLAYLQLQKLGHDWNAELGSLSKPSLYISHFQFQKERDGMANRNTITVMMDLISQIQDNLSNIHFQNMSLSYHPRIKSANVVRPYELERPMLHFNNVSRNFIAEFFSITHASVFTSFSHLSIPHLPGTIFYGSLKLEGIMNTPQSPLTHDDSLFNILPGWTGEDLAVCRCPSFNDELLDWLAEDVNGKFDTPYMMRLHIEDCAHFTPTAMRRFIAARNDTSNFKLQSRIHSFQANRLQSIYVNGTGPALGKEDIEWFDGNAEKMNLLVDWRVVDANGSLVPGSSYQSPLVR
ncbi:hypothetical protein BDZ97DRAFT_1346025 [Flammula alnicola]|nr:hypothetical protein BDZ97DRAFT_1346025 [Flammula alnicola]